MVLDLFGVEGKREEPEISIERLREWWTYERLPADWEPVKRIDLISTFLGSRLIRRHMENIKNQQQQPMNKSSGH